MALGIKSRINLPTIIGNKILRHKFNKKPVVSNSILSLDASASSCGFNANNGIENGIIKIANIVDRIHNNNAKLALPLASRVKTAEVLIVVGMVTNRQRPRDNSFGSNGNACNGNDRRGDKKRILMSPYIVTLPDVMASRASLVSNINP